MFINLSVIGILGILTLGLCVYLFTVIFQPEGF
ncbi:K(+)-transporting ATPase subunit F [Kamptonema formosum]|nr:K(+)-transporting ATPase subunit F [Oscillatoria sp. PCC 10802]